MAGVQNQLFIWCSVFVKTAVSGTDFQRFVFPLEKLALKGQQTHLNTPLAFLIHNNSTTPTTLTIGTGTAFRDVLLKLSV
jgi:hypothetical protein